MSPRYEKKKRPLPVIDLGQLLGYSNSRLKTANAAHNDEDMTRPPKQSLKAPSLEQAEKQGKDAAALSARLSRLKRDKEPKHPGASIQGLGSMTGLSFSDSLLLEPYSSSRVGVMLGGKSGTVGDSSLAVASARQTRNFLPVQNDTVDTKLPAMPTKVNGSNEAQQQSRTVTLELLQGDGAKAGKLKPTATSTQHAMPNRNRCVPLEPVPAVCPTTLEDAQSVSLPDFQELINYDYFGKESKDGKKTCVMCNVTCQCLQKKRDHKDDLPFILQNQKGVCNDCHDVVWIIVESKLAIRFCGCCKTFRPWAAFQGKDGRMLVKTCNNCTSQKRERYQKKKRESAGTEAASNALVPTEMRCVLLPQPVKLPPLRTPQGTVDTAPLPSLDRIVNHPSYLRKSTDKNGMKSCVMCKKSLPCLMRSAQDATGHYVPFRNSGVCTLCEATVWQMAETGVRIKWCAQCNRFRPWTDYRGDDKSKATKHCCHCLKRKKKKRSASVATGGGVA